MTDLFAQLAALDCAATVVVGDNMRSAVFRHELQERLGYERASTVTILVVHPDDISKLRGRRAPVLIDPAMPYSMTVASACFIINENWQRMTK